jgi:FkbM family methyltransferase
LKRPITLVDVGANIGDTILVLEANCPGMIDDFLCVDGDPEFFAYLENNLAHLARGKLVLTLLSGSDGTERRLVRYLQSTASAHGNTEAAAQTLDSVIAGAAAERLDVLKTDVDGLDGKVLRGARQTLIAHRPAVIFEWHPLLCQATSNNWCEHFEALEECGYEQFIWFNKYGEFSHYSGCGERGSVARLAELCLHSQSHYDWHYDVIALPPQYRALALPLAELAYARRRRSAH